LDVALLGEVDLGGLGDASAGEGEALAVEVPADQLAGDVLVVELAGDQGGRRGGAIDGGEGVTVPAGALRLEVGADLRERVAVPVGAVLAGLGVAADFIGEAVELDQALGVEDPQAAHGVDGVEVAADPSDPADVDPQRP